MTGHDSNDVARDTLVGRTLDDRFQILERLGSGSMGEVYVALQLDQKVTRAVKVIERFSGVSNDAAVRFRREAMALSRLQHEGIVRIVHFGRLEDELTYLVMELIDGPTLSELVEKSGPLPVKQAVRVLMRLADALAYAHSRGVVHRDLKPSNVLLHDGAPRQARLVDFGLVKLVSEDLLTQITGDEQILGTPMYMSPEQCRAREVGPPTDVYSLAGIGYYVLSGQPVFKSGSVMGLFLAQTHQLPERLRIRCPDLALPAELEELLLRCLDKSAEARPTAAQLYTELGQVLGAIRTAEHPTLQAHRRTPAPERQVRTLADSLWWTSKGHLRFADETDRSAFIRQALINQITAVVEELAQDLQHHLEVSVSVPIQQAQIELLNTKIADLELQMSLATDALGDVTQARDKLRTRQRIINLTDQIEKLRITLHREYKTLFKYVQLMRSQVTDPELLGQYEELDELLARYGSESPGLGPGTTLVGMP